MPQKRMIVIEGLDGSGKTTQAGLLMESFKQNGVPARHIKLPDYEDPSSTLVKMYLAGDFGKEAGDVNAYAASALYAVDRFASFSRHWGGDYNNGVTILADRYVTSNAVHQTVKLPQSEWDGYLAWLEDLEYKKIGIPKPDTVIYLDMPPDVSQALLAKRYGGNEAKKDIHERDRSYLSECREVALYVADKWGWRVINCAENGEPLGIDSIHKLILEIVYA